jgi:dienelactone hydrolase
MLPQYANKAMLLLTVLAFAASQNASKAQDRRIEEGTTSKKISAPYATAHAKPLDAKEELVNRAEDHTQYRVEFNGIKGDRVPAFLYLPKRNPDAKPAPAILLQYGSGGNKKTNYIVEIGKLFVSRGYVVLTIDSPNQGERRSKDKKSFNPLGLAGTEQVMHYCGDYSRAVDFLESRPDVNKERLGYVGISWGAITGIVYCAYDPRIKAVGSMVGGGNFLGLFTPEDAERCAREGSKSSDPVCHVARIAPRPLLFINVKKDQLIMRPWAESLHKYAGAGSKVVWLDTDHYFRDLDRAALCASVIDFMDREMCGKRAVEKQQ